MKCLLAVFFTLLLVSLALADSAPPKAPTPDATALKDAMQTVNEAYKDDLAKAVTQQKQQELAKKLLQAGIETNNDPAGRFALFTKAKDVAIQYGDINTAFAVIDQLNQNYQIDALKMKADTATAMAKAVRPKDDASDLLKSMNQVINEAITADRYALAKQVADAALAMARQNNDPSAIREAAQHVADVKVCGATFDKLKAPLTTLAEKPSDHAANLAVGKFRCFYKSDWDGGLPMLVLGSDSVLKDLAAKDVAGATDATAQVAVGDGWWSVAEKEGGIVQGRIRQHAGKWYSEALPNLAGLDKAKVEARLKILSNLEPTRVVNLLKLVDVSRNAVKGKWELRNGTLTSDGTLNAEVEFFFQPPAEYDYRIVFARNEVNNSDTASVLYANGHQFSFVLGGWGNTIAGFGMIGGKPPNENPTTRHAKTWLELGRRYICIVKVRKDRVQAYLDDKLITEWKTDYSDMSLVWCPMSRNDTIGLRTQNPTVFYSAEIIEITGKGKDLR